ncbi:MAG: hypothetical protein JWM99_3411 [Verrucomicrobiales bacterium]|jgi:hypothetical protein|nr:hypothetical protein [Verrucomicrobiales bacterium]
MPEHRVGGQHIGTPNVALYHKVEPFYCHITSQPQRARTLRLDVVSLGTYLRLRY